MRQANSKKIILNGRLLNVLKSIISFLGDIELWLFKWYGPRWTLSTFVCSKIFFPNSNVKLNYYVRNANGFVKKSDSNKVLLVYNVLVSATMHFFELGCLPFDNLLLVNLLAYYLSLEHILYAVILTLGLWCDST